MDGQNEITPIGPGAIPQARRPIEPLSIESPPQVPFQRPGGVVDADRGQVLSRYARLMRSGRPETCRAGRRELPQQRATGSDGKVIYPDRTAAESAARELEALGGRPQRSYLCARSRRGHFHLTTDHAAARTLHELIPRQRG